MPTLRILMRNASASLAENINSNTLQAYIFCFISALQTCTDAHFAAQLFWLGIGTSQAHPLLFASSAALVEAAAACVSRCLEERRDFGIFLLRHRNISANLTASTEDLEELLETHFTQENFSFALVSLFAKGLHQQDTLEATTGTLLWCLSICC